MAYTTNLNIVLDKIEKDLEFLGTKGMTNLLNDISSSIMRNNRERIHSEGKAVNGSPIGGGRYSQKPMLTGAKNFKTPAMASNFFNANKKSKKWVTVKGKSLAVVSDGYKEFRELNGLITNKVNLYFTGDLSNGFTYSKSTKNSFQIGFNSTKNFDKSEWLEDKYHQSIWGIGSKEEKDIDLLIDSYLDKL